MLDVGVIDVFVAELAFEFTVCNPRIAGPLVIAFALGAFRNDSWAMEGRLHGASGDHGGAQPSVLP